MSSEANVVKDLIDRGLQTVRADMARFDAGLHSMTASSDAPPASALTALRTARDDAETARQALLHAPGHIRLYQGGSQALTAFLHLNQGLAALLRGLSSGGSTASRELATARSLLTRSGDEFLKADRALGCPFGCRKPGTP